ncbi:Nif3-like dinuclear metal center hexameric protein [Helicobacter brantae]|uniref:GTP cyclohydrolase 1 type 2 homolog n=1 Tax=Helicobacter brantae TaxID=375927 RepID=A0A3D8J2W7_9HELI|nr:Nif3-like dinuclear metal center hexameric protein [Helicobacter brantae]RDU71495.1 Nif3-like dinuclear metal center hexameric protein [Helicobacter brantae]
MPKVREIYQICDEISPFALQEKWDNSGLNLGNMEQEVSKIYLSLEVDTHLAQKVERDSLIITHHPLIFSPLKNLDTSTYPSNILSLLLAKNCSLIAMHTNFDHTHLNHYFATEVLGFRDLQKIEFTLMQEIAPTPFHALLSSIHSSLSSPTLPYLKTQEEILRVYIVCGSGCSALPLITPHSRSCLITGDIKYHNAMEAKSLGISLIDVGHYESEKYFSKILHKDLKNFGYEAIISDLENPLTQSLRKTDE